MDSPGHVLLSPPCITSPAITLTHAFSLLDFASSASCLLVVEGDCLQGIVTPGDMVRHLAQGRSPDDLCLADVMTQPVISLQLSEFTDLSMAIAHLQQRQIRYLPILEGDRILGVATSDQIYKLLWQTVQEQALTLTSSVGDVNVHVIASNVSQDRQIDVSLGEREERWQLALQSYDAGLWDRDFKNNITFRSHRWKEIRGLCNDDVGDDNAEWSDRIHPSDRDRVLAALNDYVAHNALSYKEEYRVRRKDGNYVWIQDQGRAVWDENGNIVRMVGAEIDITERKRSESEARLLRERLQFVLSTSPVIIYACKPDAMQDTTYISENVVDLLGYSLDEWQAELGLWMRLLHPDDLAQVSQRQELLLETGRCICEYRILHKEGQYRWILDEQKLIYNDQGDPTEVVGYMADISDHKQTELLVKSQEQFLRHMIDTIPHFIFVKNRESQFVLANQAIARFYGTTVEELVGQTSNAFNPNPDEVACFQVADRAVIDSGTPRIVEETITSAQGRQEYFQTVKVPIQSLDGQSRQVLGIATNITPRKRVEDQLRDSEAHLSAAQRIAQMGSWELDLQDQTIQWSDQTYEIFGLAPTKKKLTYMELRDYIHPDDIDAMDQTVQTIVQYQRPFELEYRIYRSDGQMRYILSRADLITDSDKQPYKLVGTVLDISDRRKAEIQLQEINQRLELTNAELDRATRLKDEFLANMSHELRTPLNAILGMAEGLQDGVFGALSDRQNRPIEMIERSGKHLLELINDILDLSKISAGKVELQLAPVSVKDLCDSSLSFVHQQALKKRITIKRELSTPLPPITIDELRVRQILINLLNNAVKFTPEGGQVTLSAVPELQNDQLFLRLSVQDTGIGIVNDDLKKLFQPFIQLDSTLSRQQSGTGLGLALVRQLVELHDGFTTVTSVPGTGSCFTAWLPYASSTVEASMPLNPPTSQAELREKLQQLVLSKESLSIDSETVHMEDSVTSASSLILLAEDNDMNSITISSYLTTRGYHLITARTGDEAIAQAQSRKPDLILMDIQMPGMDGLEAIHHLRTQAATATTPIIAITALSMPGDRDRCLGAGANHYLSKPVKLKQLLKLIQQSLQAQTNDAS